jgi:serine/threonine-protein kinase
VDDRYRLKHRIGSGGMSVVYLAERVDIGEPAAIKFLRSAFANLPDFVRRFEQEAQACRMLDHSNCMSVIDFGVAFGSPYLVMELVSGRMISELVSKGPLPPKRCIRITQQILSGLRHAHERGVVHRDLKPGNIMLVEQEGSTDLIKIMDFGTAQLMSREPADPRRGGTDVGTPWYMAPEQAAGQPTDQRTDLYAVGVMLFEMLTGDRPYTADDPMRVLEMHLSSPIPSARALKPEMGLSPELEAVVVKALQKQPTDRFGSAEEFDQALQRTPEVRPRRRTTGSMERLQLEPAPAVRPPPVAPPPASAILGAGTEATSRRKIVILGLAAGGLVLLAAVLFMLLS